MANIDGATWKLSLRDLLIGGAFLVTIALNYATVSHNQTDSDLRQSAVNTVTNLQLQALKLQVDKQEIELQELDKRLQLDKLDIIRITKN